MTLPFEFQMMLRVDNLGLEPSPPSKFKALVARCDEEKILSVDYIGPDCFEKAKEIDQQNQQAKDLKSQLIAYFRNPSDPAKSECFRNLPLCNSMLTPRERADGVSLLQGEQEKRAKVRGEVCKIPCGGVAVYSDIAKKIDGWNNKDGNQAVGDACRNSPFAVIVPCYRVVSKNRDERHLGQLGNNAYLEYEFQGTGWDVGRQIKRWLIEREKGWKVVGVPDDTVPPPDSELRVAN